MEAFAELLNRLAYTPGRNAKLGLMSRYFVETPDPDRGWALAVLTDGLPFSFPVRKTLQELMAPRVDELLFRLSRDYVGDTAETVALLWPDAPGKASPPRLSELVAKLELAHRSDLPHLIESWLNQLDSNGRWALLKMLTGALRVGVSARLAKTAGHKPGTRTSRKSKRSGMRWSHLILICSIGLRSVLSGRTFPACRCFAR